MHTRATSSVGQRCPTTPCLHFPQEPKFLPHVPGQREVYQFLGQRLPTGNVARIPGFGILSPSGVSTVCQGWCCGRAGSTRLHTMGKSNINWAACLQEAEAALEESSPTVQRARSEIWFLGSPCCSNQETSVSDSLGKTGLPGEYVVKNTAGFAQQAPKAAWMQEGTLEPGFSGIALLAGRKTGSSHSVKSKIPAPSMNHHPSRYNHHGCMQGSWGTAWGRDVLIQQYILPPVLPALPPSPSRIWPSQSCTA